MRTVAVSQQNLPVEIRAIGNVEAYSNVAVKSRVAGQLIRVHVRDGQSVQQDQLLFEIDPLPLEAQLRQAEANVARDRAMEQQAQASIARSRAQASQARVQADRYAALAREGITSKEQTEQFRSVAEAADAGVKADLSAIESARASIRADEARVAEARLSLGYTKIHAPISGHVGAVMIKEGNLVKENDTTPLVTILQITPVYVSFAVPEKWIEEIRKYMRTSSLSVLATSEGSERSDRGVLDSIDNSVDSTTGTIRLKAKFPNNSLSLWPGGFANVVMTLRTERRALIIPVQAVQNRQEGSYVWIAKDNLTAELRPIKLSRTQGDVAVVESGVASGERVITEGQLRVTPGARLTISTGQTLITEPGAKQTP
ncbi:MAG: efflux RND transporter periplasmic adaptor subunit [Nitrospiraceae bacterium]|nr:efflux RND transporter periplasmic adaptor subunit [Nitrospiraceae bacterium]